MQTGESLEWGGTGHTEVLRFSRPAGWQVVSNFGTSPFPMPEGEVLLASGPITDVLPGETTVWLRTSTSPDR